MISVPDKWEYPWYAAWDLAFHMVPFAKLDPDFAKDQLLLFLREWYMHPNGQLPAYEWQLVGRQSAGARVGRLARLQDDRRGRPPRPAVPGARVSEAAAQLHVVGQPQGRRRAPSVRRRLPRARQHRRVRPLRAAAFGPQLEQADGTAWMAFYCSTMLSMALELAREDPTYEDMASKFFEHFVAIVDAMNELGGTGLWDEADGFYYDRLSFGRTRGAAAGPIDGRPAAAVRGRGLDQRTIDGAARLQEAARVVPRRIVPTSPGTLHTWSPRRQRDGAQRLLAIPSRERLERVLRYMLDEREFLSPFGIRSVSRIHESRPFILRFNGDAASPGLLAGRGARPDCSAATRTGAGRSGCR